MHEDWGSQRGRSKAIQATEVLSRELGHTAVCTKGISKNNNNNK